uniref:gamma-tubulin complex component 6 isoform X2 n=1 Tax=Fragaria vesca subsp. vesca TaxID=101020 RepID=UPI0005CB0595|nr:PREDICTED: gamma-tubulin complex component 6 isoform X2 [Fragaria vesca subsp. vesca]
MNLDTDFTSALLHDLKLEDPLLPPTTWESIPSESGHFHLPSSNPLSLYHASSVSEASLVRLAMNALQGLESSLISVQKLSAAFRSDAADRTFHQVPSLWSRSSSTQALGNILHSIGCSGLLVFLLGKFVDHFTNLDVESGSKERESAPYSLVNQAFVVAVGKVVEGYMCALDTLYASVGLRRGSPPSAVGCLNSVVHSEVSLLEVYLHTKELRTQIESLANICNLYRFSDCFAASCFDELLAEAKSEFCNFYRGGDLLTYLYTQLQVADPAHRPVLKFLFLRACEPYFGFIRSWIFKAEISDPYEEFLVEYVQSHDPYVEASISTDFPLATIRERDGVPVPCFLKDILIPLLRAGQQLQVLAKLLQLCTFVAPTNHTYETFLPCWSGFSSNCPSYASPLTFSKGNIEAMVLSRECYYKKMQDRLQILLTELEFKFQQVVPQDALVLLDHSGRSSAIPVLVPSDKSYIEKESQEVADDLDSDELSTRDYTADEYESSECSSSTMSEEQNVLKRTPEFPSHIIVEEQKYFSALSFSIGIPVDTVQKPHGCADSCLIDKISSCEREDAFGHSHHKGILMSQMLDVQFSDCLSDKDWPDYFEKQSVIDIEYKEGLKSSPTDFASKVNERITGALKEGSSYFRKRIMDNNASIEEAFGKIESQKASNTSDTFALRQWKVNYHNNFLSMNPMLTKNNFLHLTSRPEERCKTDHGDSLAYFDFSHIKDPCKVFPMKVPVGLMDYRASNTNGRSDHHVKECSSGDDVLIGRTIVSDFLPSSDLRGHSEGDATSTNVSGGSCWESLLGRFGDTVVNRLEDHRESLAASFDMPLDFIIDKCLLQEIMLQYKYVSKLTINLLEEGFDLQEHLLALRRYHFMELADWADLFIMSLWHHKWSITQADHRLSEIQSFLESSVQRSSCERDRNKDRLFMYLKGHDAVPLSASAIGVHSFNFLGLGYRVDWPISIVLTPGALKKYAEIFSFLIQVKLALFSLTDVWRQLKDLIHLIYRNNHSEEHEKEVSHFNAIVKMRHQVNHFVSTLQQYVESQLSHVSWCRFLYSLKHKVKDMMDLQSVHMAYLSDSLHICFLSDETKPIACIIESILQCALDFRSCLTGGVWNAGTGQGNLVATLSGINISQVIAIKRTFDKNMKELHSCYLKSPKHGEFGLSHFWEYLNYNRYYSDAASVVHSSVT